MASTTKKKNPQRLAMRNVSPKGAIRNAQPADNDVVSAPYGSLYERACF